MPQKENAVGEVPRGVLLFSGGAKNTGISHVPRRIGGGSTALSRRLRRICTFCVNSVVEAANISRYNKGVKGGNVR